MPDLSFTPRRPPRVLQLCAVDFTVRQFLAPLAIHLREKGCEVDVACTPGPYWDELRSMGLDMVPLRIARTANLGSHAVSALRLYRLLRRNRYDVLHVHTPVASLIGRFAGRLAGVPHIIYTAHGFYFHDRMPPWKRRVHILLERLAGRFQDHLFCVSEEDARAAEDHGIARPLQIHVVSNGVDPGRYDAKRMSMTRGRTRSALGIPEDAPVAMMMGRLTREKGFFEFVEGAREVLADCPQAHFLVVGGGVARERDSIFDALTRLAESAGLKGHVHLLGHRTDIPELLAASDVFCLPSYREGMPISIIEAMMMGLPVVATRIRGCREEVVDGETGFLIEVGDARELAGAVSYLIRHPEMAAKLGAAGHRRAVQHYSLKPLLERQWGIYQEILGAERVP